MAASQWHKSYASTLEAPAPLLFRLLSDMPNYLGGAVDAPLSQD